MEIDNILVSRLASIAVHADEIAEFGSATMLQLIQLKALIDSSEVQQFIKEAGALAPIKR